MKIYFDNVDFSSNSGPNGAVRRLAKQMAFMGHTIADHSDYNIALVTIEPTPRLNCRKHYVQRIDGIWFKEQDFEKNNVSIARCYEHASGVVFQSHFDESMVTKWFGEPQCEFEVIHNGIELEHVTVTVPELFELRNKFEKIFVCSSNWHPQKRLRDNVRSFKHLQSTQFHNSCLIVMGANPDHVVADKTIFYTGDQSEDVCLQVFATADWMLHLAWADHCPNVCLQSLSQETPVVCADVGGTKELIGKNNRGIVICDVPYNFELADYDNPPQMNVSDIVLPTERLVIDSSDLSIEICAKKYIELFERILQS